MLQYHEPDLFPVATAVVDIVCSSDEINERVYPMLLSLRNELLARANVISPNKTYEPETSPEVAGISVIQNFQARCYISRLQLEKKLSLGGLLKIAAEMAVAANLPFKQNEFRDQTALFQWFDLNWEAIVPFVDKLEIMSV